VRAEAPGKGSIATRLRSAAAMCERASIRN
jgi:hypothetical protein